VSPDGRYIAFAAGDNSDALQIYTYDLVTGDSRQLTFEGDHDSPEWSPDGEWIVFNTFGGGLTRLSIMRADGAGDPETLLESDTLAVFTGSWHGDETVFVCNDGTGNDTCSGRMVSDGNGWTIEMDASTYLGAEWVEREPRFSPEGDLVALVSRRGSDTDELYVATWPDPLTQERGTTRSQCCVYDPRWSADGATVYYQTGGPGTDTIWRIPVERDPLNLLAPEVVFTGLELIGIDVFDDGRILMSAFEDGSAPALQDGAAGDQVPIRHFLVVNWQAELERKLVEARGR
jgi:Tol biopolymer transport system component